MAGHRLIPGTWGQIGFTRLATGAWQAKTRYRRYDGVKLVAKASGRTQSAARRALEVKLTALIHDRHDTVAEITPDSRFVDLCTQWIEEVELVRDGRPSTRHEEVRIVKANIIPSLGNVRLRELRVSTVYAAYKDWYAATPSMSRNIKGVLRKVCALGVRLDVLQSNPVDQIRNFKRPEPVLYAPTPYELDELRAHIAAFDNRPGRRGPKSGELLLDTINMILATSARISEALGIRVMDVDLHSDPPTVTIAGQVIEGDGQPKHWSPLTKTESGLRRIAVPGFIIPTLHKRIARARAANTPYLFHTRNGTPNGAQDVHRILRAVRKWAGIPDDMIPHALRKSVATAISQHESGGMIAAAKILGHKEARVTEAHYAKRALDTPDVRHILDQNRPGASEQED
jgi:integrase